MWQLDHPNVYVHCRTQRSGKRERVYERECHCSIIWRTQTRRWCDKKTYDRLRSAHIARFVHNHLHLHSLSFWCRRLDRRWATSFGLSPRTGISYLRQDVECLLGIRVAIQCDGVDYNTAGNATKKQLKTATLASWLRTNSSIKTDTHDRARSCDSDTVSD